MGFCSRELVVGAEDAQPQPPNKPNISRSHKHNVFSAVIVVVVARRGL